MHRKVKFDWEDLITAFQGSGFDECSYLDLETGEVISVIRENADSFEMAEIEQRVDSKPERYEVIPCIDSGEAYDDMVRFIDTVEDGHVAELLSIAIRGKGAFRMFKDVLLTYPAERERWFKFQRNLMIRRIDEWLQAIDVEPTPQLAIH